MATAARELARPAPRSSRFSYHLAEQPQEIDASLRLRHRVFIEEMGADAAGAVDGTESDRFDSHCRHLLVHDRHTGAVVASTRILTQTAARVAGGFYSAGEFDLSAILTRPGRFMEIGRTCVDPAYRRGGVIGVLWAGVSDFIRRSGHDHVIGCASIDVSRDTAPAHAIFRHVADRYLCSPEWRVTPRLPLPDPQAPIDDTMRLPPLLKAYLSLGAQVGGAPCWDPAFGVADLFMHLDVANLCPRYARHFLHRNSGAPGRLALVS